MERIDDEQFYSVLPEGGGCEHCGQGHLWTVTWKENGEAVSIGQSFLDKEHAQDICEHMNFARWSAIKAYRESGALEALKRLQNDYCNYECERCPDHLPLCVEGRAAIAKLEALNA